MRYDFDTVIDRRNTNSMKHDFAKEFGKPEGLIPLWVADMDFPAPREVVETLKKCAGHGIYGYTDTKEDYYNAVRNWFLKGFDFDIKPEWLVKAPGVVFAIAASINSFTAAGDGVLIQQPVYYPFFECIKANGRKVINAPLVYKNGTYTIDFEDFERKITENNVKLFLLCSPHNPVGRVWSAEELTSMGEICAKHNCLVVSDEIHCDFVYNGYKHHVFGSLSPAFLDNSILCTAPSKTFNLAGLQAANIFITNAGIRRKFIHGMNSTGYLELNIMGLAACQSAYEHGGDWLSQLKEYLTGNLAYARGFLREKLPPIKLVEPEGTYLAWLDCKALGFSQPELDSFITHKAKLWLDGGTKFGAEGEGFQRINIACPRAVLERALLQLESALLTEKILFNA